jgi:hypothetical protein
VIYTPQDGRTPADNLQSRDQGLRRLVEIRELLAAHPDKFELALTAEDAPRIKSELFIANPHMRWRPRALNYRLGGSNRRRRP